MSRRHHEQVAQALERLRDRQLDALTPYQRHYRKVAQACMHMAAYRGRNKGTK